MAEINPYQAPQARVKDPAPAGAALAATPQTVDAGRAIAWFTEGWGLFRREPAVWIGIGLIALVILIVLAFIPFIGQMGNAFLSILFAGGLMLGCRALDRGEPLSVGHLFAAFHSHVTSLLLLGALYLGALFVLFLIVALAGGGTAVAVLSGHAGNGLALMSMVVVGLGVVLLMIPLAMAMWFAPALVTLHDVAPIDAIKLSFRGCLHNWLAFLVYLVLGFILAMLASIPLALGWLVLIPVMAASVYAGYKDIFLQR